MSGERLVPVTLGTVVRRAAVQAADNATVAGTCPHAGARFVSALDPAAGVWCVDCGHRPLGDLLASPWCVCCDSDAFARPGLTAARAGRLEILLRVCDPCLTREEARP